MRKTLLPALAAASLSLCAASAQAAGVVHVNPAKSFISKAVVVPAGSDTLYVSGITPQPADPAKPTELGDTKAQAASILSQIAAILKDQGYAMEDVVMMRVYLAGDPAKGGKMDFGGMMESYKAVYDPLPNKPARVTVQVAALVAPTMLCEIEVQAAKAPEKPAAKPKK